MMKRNLIIYISILLIGSLELEAQVCAPILVEMTSSQSISPKDIKEAFKEAFAPLKLEELERLKESLDSGTLSTRGSFNLDQVTEALQELWREIVKEGKLRDSFKEALAESYKEKVLREDELRKNKKENRKVRLPKVSIYKQEAEIDSFAISPNGKFAALADRSGDLKIFEIERGLKSVKLKLKNRISTWWPSIGLVFSSDSTRIGSFTQPPPQLSPHFAVGKLMSKSLLEGVVLKRSNIEPFKVSIDGGRVMYLRANNHFESVPFGKGDFKEVKDFPGTGSAIYEAKFTQLKKGRPTLVMTFDYERKNKDIRKIRVGYFESDKFVDLTKPITLDEWEQPYDVNMTADGRYLSMLSANWGPDSEYRVMIWDLKNRRSPKQIFQSKGIHGTIKNRSSLKTSQDGRWLAVVWDGRLRVMDRESQDSEIEIGVNNLKDFAFIGDSRSLLLAEGSQLTLFNPEIIEEE